MIIPSANSEKKSPKLVITLIGQEEEEKKVSLKKS